jgi:type VI protein secretion system component Hcp
MKTTFSVLITLLCLVPFALSRGIEVLLKIPGIHGGCQVKGYEGYIVLHSFSFGVETRGPSMVTMIEGRTPPGKPEFDQIVMSKQIDGASASLARLAFSGDRMTDVEVVIITQDGTSAGYREIQRFKLDHAVVGGWTTQASPLGGIPGESFHLDYDKIASVIAGPLNARGEATKPDTFSWDLVANRPWGNSGIKGM